MRQWPERAFGELSGCLLMPVDPLSSPVELGGRNSLGSGEV